MYIPSYALLVTKTICRPNYKNVVIQIWQEKAARREFIRHGKTFLDFNIPEALMHYGMILQINMNWGFFKWGVYISVTNRRPNIFHAPVEKTDDDRVISE